MRPVPGAEIATALPIAGLALMVLNDAVLRWRWPGLVTGKLSDFAVVLFFPFLLTATFALLSAAARALARVVAPIGPDPGLSRARLAVAMAITAFALAAINLSYRARDLYLGLLERLDVFDLMPSFGYTVDAADLVGLLALPAVWWWGARVMVAPAR